MTDTNSTKIQSDIKPPRYKDLTGQVFGRWSVLHWSRSFDDTTYWMCHCECGTEREVKRYSLVSGQSTSCGCFQREQMAMRGKGESNPNFKHGLSNTPTWARWQQMKRRCYDPNHDNYSYYGGKGITVCDRWRESYANFLEDMGELPTSEHTIERIDRNGNYCPENCYWEPSRIVQNNNTSQNRFFTLNGVTLTMAQWAREYDMPYSRLQSRLASGWELEAALKTPFVLHKDRKMAKI